MIHMCACGMPANLTIAGTVENANGLPWAYTVEACSACVEDFILGVGTGLAARSILRAVHGAWLASQLDDEPPPMLGRVVKTGSRAKRVKDGSANNAKAKAYPRGIALAPQTQRGQARPGSGQPSVQQLCFWDAEKGRFIWDVLDQRKPVRSESGTGDRQANAKRKA